MATELASLLKVLAEAAREIVPRDPLDVVVVLRYEDSDPPEREAGATVVSLSPHERH